MWKDSCWSWWFSFLKNENKKTPQEPKVLETSKTNPRYPSNCEIAISPPLRSPSTSMHWRSIHGKRLLGDAPLGLPAQKWWEFHSPLTGSHHPPTLWKIRCGFRLHQRLCELLIEFEHTLPQWSSGVNTVVKQKKPSLNAKFLHHAQMCAIKRQSRSFLL